jgi:hypothetical protein
MIKIIKEKSALTNQSVQMGTKRYLEVETDLLHKDHDTPGSTKGNKEMPIEAI